MRTNRTIACALTVGAFVVAAGAPAAEAQLSPGEVRCLQGVANEARKFVWKKLKTIATCNEENLKTPGRCAPGYVAEAIARFEAMLSQRIGQRCKGMNQFTLANMGYAGKCADATPCSPFVLADLQVCIAVSHEAIVDHLIDVEYGDTGTAPGPLSKPARKCQNAIAKHAQKYTVTTLKVIQRCRNGILGAITGVLPENCATGDPRTSDGIARAERKARAEIATRCTDTDIAALDVCDPRALTVEDALDCLFRAHRDAVDTTDITKIDLIDVEYPSARASICGDGVRNTLDEECDGDDAAACPGECGPPDGLFGCLCLNIPRQRVVEHANADLDEGWTGSSHDSGVVEGGGYIVDLYDCDNVTDFDCTVGPSCAIAPHPPCHTDAQCQLLGLGDCRKRRTAVGPRCNGNIQQVCGNDADCPSDPGCPGSGDFCVKQFHGPPLPLSSGGVSVCVINVFSEDVVGTTNLQTGAGAVRLRQASITYLGPVADQPCPVCGGFCAGYLGMGGTPGQRRRCTQNSDCPSNNCILENICSYGANADKECRPDPPFGGSTDLFGNPSVDCGPPPGSPISGPAGLDILFDPATTGSVQLIPAHECDNLAFAGNRCVGGADEGRPCATDASCSGGTCNEQCFCPSGGGRPQQPNYCNNACVGGPNDGLLCTNDGQCAPGFCHTADCRPNPLDAGSSEEGACTAGPFQGTCSVTKFKSCASAADCQSVQCPFCGVGETCVFAKQQCFVNSGINRSGAPGVSDKDTAAIFCIAPTGSAVINNVVGLPGPGAITNPVTTLTVGF